MTTTQLSKAIEAAFVLIEHRAATHHLENTCIPLGDDRQTPSEEVKERIWQLKQSGMKPRHIAKLVGIDGIYVSNYCSERAKKAPSEKPKRLSWS